MKKVYYCLFMLVALFMVVSPVLAVDADGCTSVANVDVKIVNIIHTVILVIQIVIPVVLVIFGTIDFLKAVTSSKEDEIKKGQQTFIKRAIAAIIVFFVIAIVKLLVGFVADDKNKDTILNCVNCFLNGADKTTGECKE